MLCFYLVEKMRYNVLKQEYVFFFVKGPAADATEAPQP
jgi:hypothetical protein